MSTELTIENPLDWRSRALLAESEEERLRAENERLRADLGIYGDHLASCWLRQSPRVEVVGRSRCNCGYFLALFKGLDEPKDG